MDHGVNQEDMSELAGKLSAQAQAGAIETPYTRRGRSWPSRALTAMLVCLLWTQSISFTHDAAVQDAAVLAGGLGVHAYDWHLDFGMTAAVAGPITDPYAPIQFQPQVTESTGANGGVPVVNITAPNAAGISLNQYTQFNVDPVGLILNNSFGTGVSLTGGTVAGNPNLSGRAASTIVNQVSSTGAQYASVINGPIEVFGAPANVVIANPNGITATGVGFTNTPNITLTTGVPQFISGVGGNASDFTNGTALAYNVTSGHIQIEGAPGNTGPGPGLTGTVGEVDLIGQTIGINAPLYGGPRVNLIAGNQLVAPQTVDANGTSFGVTSNGTANTAAAINTTNQLAIDATSFGAVTAGQIAIVATPAGLGVRADAALAATANNLTISSNGDLSVASTTAPLTISLASTGNTAITGTNSANQYAVSAGGNITGTGAITSATTLSMTASGSLSTGADQATGNITLVAQGGNLIAGTLASGANLSLGANGDLSAASTSAQQVAAVVANGNVTLSGINVAALYGVLAGGSISVPNAIGSATTLGLTAGTGVSAGTVQANGNATLTAQSGDVTTTAVVAGGTLNVAGSGNVSTGTVQAAGNTALAAQGGNLTTAGVSVGGNLIASARGTLDTSAGQSNAAYSASAPALVVSGTAGLSATNITTANVTVAGAYTATATGALNTGGTAIYSSTAALNGSSLTNVGQQIASGNLAVTAGTVTNQSGAQLASLQGTTIGSANLTNAGTIYGTTLDVTNSNGVTNTGALLAQTTLNLATAQLNNTNGAIFSGDTTQPTANIGNTTITVNGGAGSFINTSGQILGQNSLTVNLPNQAFDPSAGTAGVLNGGAALNFTAQSINNTGTWSVPGTVVNVTGTNGISNSGTISQTAGSLTLNGAMINTGTVLAPVIRVAGSLNNQSTGLVQASDTFNLTGSGTNTGNVQAVNAINISGLSYNNAAGTTQAGNASTTAGNGNLTINLSGDLGNSGGVLTSKNDLSITASNINNSLAAGTTTTTTTTTVLNGPLVTSTPLGTEYSQYLYTPGGDPGELDVGNTSTPVTLADVLSPTGSASTSSSVATSGTVQFVQIPTTLGTNNHGFAVVSNLYYVQTGSLNGDGISQTLTIPLVNETVTTTSTPSGTSFISAGHNLTVTANSLNNVGGTIGAANNASLNLQSLSNGGTAYTSSVTDTVDLNSLNAFLTALQTIPLAVSSSAGTSLSCLTSQCTFDGITLSPTSFVFSAPGSVAAPTTSSSIVSQGVVGQIVAGNNLALSGGNLVNAGTLASGQDLTINANSFTNQGFNTGAVNTVSGCAGGNTNVTCTQGPASLANSQTFAYQQINSTVAAGRDIVIAANAVTNMFGTLAAGRNVVIGGPGTVVNNTDPSNVVTSLTTAANVSNISGTITAGQDVLIQASNFLNATAAAAQIHEYYGSDGAYAGCGGGLQTFCEAFLDVQSADVGLISADRNINIQTDTFANNGALIYGLNNVDITATASATNTNQTLNAYWHGASIIDGRIVNAYGCTDATICQSLYGNLWNENYNAPPTPVGFIPGTIHAGNSLTVASPTLSTSGNVYGTTIGLTGSTLVNGLTSQNQFTPGSTNSQQVMSLAPNYTAAGHLTGLTNGSVASNSGINTANAPIAPNAPVTSGTYLVNNPAAQVINGLGPSALLQALPANLQPANLPFYYDPYDESNQVEQAALLATGKGSFDPNVNYSSQSAVSIANQDKAYLYGNAAQFAEQNGIALGTALTSAQLQLVSAPMLWYVQQAVPAPGCIATGNAACATVQALVPEVLLPPNYSSVNAVGTIAGQNVTLNYQNGSVTNTGTMAAQNLSINTTALTNQARLTNVGDILNGFMLTTGTTVQPGGFISAVNYDLNVSSINQIGGVLQKINPDGTTNTAATAQLISNLQLQLGTNYAQSAVQNNLQTSMVFDDSAGWMQTVGMLAIVIAASVMSAGAAAAALPASIAATSVVGGAIIGAAAGLGGSLASGALAGNLTLSSVLKGIAVGAITGGALNGITIATDDVGNLSIGLGSLSSAPGAGVQTLAQFAGVNPVRGFGVPAATATTVSLPEQALAVAAEATIQASVQTAVEGGSFLNNLKTSGVSDAAAAIAFDIGTEANSKVSIIPPGSPGYILAHAALGCATSAALGTGCASGAIGGAVSAATTNEIATLVTNGQGVTDPGQLAAIVAATTLLGGTAAGLLGQNVQGAVTAAQNETLNNTCAPGHNCGTLASAVADTGRAAWNTALGVVQSIPNAVNGALPGYPDYVPFLSSAMLPYDDPDFGSLVSLVGGVGAASLVGRSTGATTATSSSATTTASGADFYVTSNGTAVPATGYRAVGGPAVDEALTGTIAPRNPTYITFDNITNMSPSAAQSLLQLPRTPTNWVSFDMLPLINDLTIPTGKWNTTTTLEPITNTFPEWGAGGGTQAITNQPIQVKGFGTLPTGTGK